MASNLVRYIKWRKKIIAKNCERAFRAYCQQFSQKRSSKIITINTVGSRYLACVQGSGLFSSGPILPSSTIMENPTLGPVLIID
jgi:hypothetical protein